ncbi:purine-nucleoside phosphorylase [bacterium]|nr:purine-nucleoside phosphorylase [bacterium]
MLNKINETVAFLNSQTDLRPKISITLGSGLASFVKEIDVKFQIPFGEIPNFSPSTVEGHPGNLVIGEIGGHDVAILQGRIHYYEGHPMEEVIFPTRVLSQFGVDTFVLTNAAGGMGDGMKPGDFMILTDHINLFGTNPLRGKNIDELGLRFPDMSEVYSGELNKKMEASFKKQGVTPHFGVYCAVSGPTYETPAEIRYLKTIGGSAVGMSTAPEAIAAVHMGKKVCAVSCVTNMAAGLSSQKLHHDEVKEVAAQVEKEFASALKDFIATI